MSPRQLTQSLHSRSVRTHSLFSRSVSTNSAINRGIRRSAYVGDRFLDLQESTPWHESEILRNGSPAFPYSPKARWVGSGQEPEDEEATQRRHLSPRLDRRPQAEYTPSLRRHIPKVNHDAEWIYGTSVVEAALRCKGREMYKLYAYAGDNRTSVVRERDRHMKRLAQEAGVEVIEERDIGMLDSMSNSRPHNGYVLECLPRRKTPITALGGVAAGKTSFQLEIAQHDHHGRPVVDQFNDKVPCRDPKRRYPFVLMLDEILDPGNLGAILRSAYFLGVDAIALSVRNCAPLSPVCLKASSGAAELLPILAQSRSDRLMVQSAEAGWTFYAAVPPPTKNQARRDRYVLASGVGEAVKKGPVVLVLGNEGDGLRPFLKKRAKYCVSLDKGPGTDTLVDSLNASLPRPTVPPAAGLYEVADNLVGQCCFGITVFEIFE